MRSMKGKSKDKIDDVLASFCGKEDELIPVLQKIQEELGYLSEEAMLRVSEFLRVPESRVYAIASFYAQFRFTPVGKVLIVVCQGTACHVRGGRRILERLKEKLGIEEGETTEDMEYTLETVACIGCCGLSPCILVNGEVKARMTSKKIDDLLKKKVQSRKNEK